MSCLAVCAIVLVLSLSAGAPQPEKVHRIGLLHSAASAVSYFTNAFRQGMRDRGYVEGKNYRLEVRTRRAKNDQLSDLAAELVRLKVDAILAVGFPALSAVKEATRTIPIVMHTGSDPVKRGLVANLAHPGGNITGVVSIGVALNAKRLQLLAETVPGVKRIAVLTPSSRIAARQGRTYKELNDAARVLGVELEFLKAGDGGEIDKAFLMMVERQAGALLVTATSQYIQHRERIIRQAAKYRLPAIYSHSTQVESGGLITYGMKYADNFRRMAIYVEKILRGAKPGDLPIEQPTKVELVINLKTAKALGLKIPAHLLLEADRVIE